MHERIDERLLQQETEGAHQRAERPAVDPGVALLVACGCDHALELGDRRVRLERGVVDVRTELFFDRPQKVDATQRVETEIGRERRARVHRGRRQVRDLRDHTLHVGERACRGLIARDGARLIDAPHREDALHDEALLHLLRRRRREFVLRPDGPAADLLAARELDVGVADDGCHLLAVLHEEDRVHLDVFTGTLETHDRRDRRTQRGRERLDARIGRERVLDVLGIDVRAVGEDDHVLLAAPQPQEAVLVELAEVAGVVPAVLVEDRARRLLVLPVPLEDIRTARDHLAVRGDLHLDAGYRCADGPETVQVDAVERERGRALGRSVPLEHIDAELAPRLTERRIEGGAAGHDVAEAAAELTVHAEEDDAAERHRQPARHATELLEELLPTLRLGAALDREHQRLHDRRRDEHHRDLALFEGAADDRGLAARRIDDRRARDQHGEEACQLLEHVRERKERQQALFRADGEDLRRGERVRQDVAMGEHRALGISRGAGGEDDFGEVVTGERGLLQRRARAREIRE